jgi:hypothetical protein
VLVDRNPVFVTDTFGASALPVQYHEPPFLERSITNRVALSASARSQLIAAEDAPGARSTEHDRGAIGAPGGGPGGGPGSTVPQVVRADFTEPALVNMRYRYVLVDRNPVFLTYILGRSALPAHSHEPPFLERSTTNRVALSLLARTQVMVAVVAPGARSTEHDTGRTGAGAAEAPGDRGIRVPARRTNSAVMVRDG